MCPCTDKTQTEITGQNAEICSQIQKTLHVEKRRSRWERRNREKGANNQLSSRGKGSLSEEDLGQQIARARWVPGRGNETELPGRLLHPKNNARERSFNSPKLFVFQVHALATSEPGSLLKIRFQNFCIISFGRFEQTQAAHSVEPQGKGGGVVEGSSWEIYWVSNHRWPHPAESKCSSSVNHHKFSDTCTHTHTQLH